MQIYVNFLSSHCLYPRVSVTRTNMVTWSDINIMVYTFEVDNSSLPLTSRENMQLYELKRTAYSQEMRTKVTHWGSTDTVRTVYLNEIVRCIVQKPSTAPLHAHTHMHARKANVAACQLPAKSTVVLSSKYNLFPISLCRQWPNPNALSWPCRHSVSLWTPFSHPICSWE